MYTSQTKIGIIGSGAVGQVLAKAFITEGNQVMLGTRHTGKPEVVQWKKDNPQGNTGTFEETAAFGEILVLAVSGAVAEEALQQAGLQNLSSKIIIDATNPIDTKAKPENGVLRFFTDINHSLMEKLQVLATEANFVKAFNSVGNAVMYKPSFKEGKPTMFIAGNSDEAKATVTTILENFGYETADMGKAEGARAIEPLSILWCIPGFIRNEWTHAFKLLKTSPNLPDERDSLSKGEAS